MNVSQLEQLHIGCGQVYFDGWMNIDLESPKADLHHDLRNPLPFSDVSVRYIYNEHFLEHLDLPSGIAFLKECYRVLRPGGILRIAMPDLQFVIDRYQNNWQNQDWLKWPEYRFIESRVQMINIAFRSWGHLYLYNREELQLRLKQCGFTEVTFHEKGKSGVDLLQNRETRPDSFLIAEASHE
ncbi:MAG: methyltransferase domain-containing protein [Nitrospiria bacterium]